MSHRARLALIALLLATAWAYRGVLELGFTDTDALANVAAARVEAPADLLRQVWQPVTGGVAGRNANFWRPVWGLHNALLRALFGWNPLGWQIWDLALHGVVVVLVFALLRAAKLRESEALLGAAVTALHPLGVEIVPAVARNMETLCCVLCLATLLAVSRGHTGVAAVAGLLAVGSKETAVVALPVAVAWAAVLGRRRAAVVLGLSWAAALPLYLRARVAVLEGWGGYHPTSPTFSFDAAWFGWVFRAAPLELLFPGWTPQIEAWLPESLGLAVTSLLLAAASVGAALAWRRGQRVPALGIALALSPLPLYAATTVYSRRLLALPLIGLSLAVAPLLGHRRLRWVLAAWLFTLLPASPLVHDDRSWRRNDAVTRAMTEGLAAELAALSEGSVVWVLDRPSRFSAHPHRTMLWRDSKSLNNGVASYSLRAWTSDALGRADLQLRFLDIAHPGERLDEPLVEVEGRTLRVRRASLERTWGPWAQRGWEVTTEGDSVRLVRRTAPVDEWMLVAGTPRAVLIGVP